MCDAAFDQYLRPQGEDTVYFKVCFDDGKGPIHSAVPVKGPLDSLTEDEWREVGSLLYLGYQAVKDIVPPPS